MKELKQKIVEEKSKTIHEVDGETSGSGSDSCESEDNLNMEEL